MSFLVLLTDEDPESWDRATEAEREAVMDAHRAFDQAVRERGAMLGGEALAGTETARTLRTLGGVRQVVDGPYAETVEQLGGFYVIDVADMDAALDLCRILPEGYTIEVRPVIQIEGDDSGALRTETRLARLWTGPGATSGAACWHCSSRTTAASTWPRTGSPTPSRRPPAPGRATAFRPIPPAGC